MSEPKDFLSRWSQRKLNPEAQKPSAEKLPLAEMGKDAAAGVAAEPGFDVTTLPSLESIGADSDVRAFLQRGVPASLTHAALRRAWSADPAIRDFVGLSENSWDFNAPDSIPGFGSLSADDVRKVAARLFGEPEEATAQTTPATAQDSAEKSAEPDQPEKHASATEAEPSATPVPEKPINVAAQHNPSEESQPSAPALPRRHGRALPQ